MKKLFSLFLALMMLLTCAAPALAEETAAPIPALIATQDYIDAFNNLLGGYDFQMEWSEIPISETDIAFTCDTLGGQPALISSDGTLIALTGGAQFNVDQAQDSLEAFLVNVSTILRVLLLSTGMDDETALQTVLDYLNSEDFIPGVISAINTGEPMMIEFQGYPGEIGLMLVDETPLLSLYLSLEQEQTPAE